LDIFMNFNKKFGLLSLRNSMVLLFCISLFSTSITFGWTQEDEVLLWAAITKGDTTEVIKLVTEKSIDVNEYLHYRHPGAWGSVRPLDVAVGCYDIEMVKTLLELGAEVNRVSSTRGMTPLMRLLYPVYNTTYEHRTPEEQKKILALVKILLDHGADPNAKNRDGMTPLIEAIRNRVSVDIVKLLLQHGADPTIKDLGGRNASDHTRKKDVEIRELLEKYTPGHSSVATNPTGSNDGADSGSAASGNPAASQSGIGQSDNPSGSKTQLSGKKRPPEDDDEEEDNNDGDNDDEEPSEGTGSLAKFGDSLIGTKGDKVAPGSETHNVPGDGNRLPTAAEPNHKKARIGDQGSGVAAETPSATSFGSTAGAAGGGASSSSSSTAPIGPNHIDGYELIEVLGDGNRFFAAVANRLLTGGHPIMHGLHAGAGQAPEELLLSRLPANEDEIARVTTTLNDIYIAIIDTRNPQAGFTYFHQGRQLNSGKRSTPSSGNSVIMLAFNGSYYLVVNSVSQKAAGQIDPKPSIHLSGPRPRPPGGPGGSGAGFGGLSSSLKNTFG
jgi:hypothetical protein